MIYKKIRIKNFKGIKNIEMDLENNRIITFVGLNESGKTTIMKAIHTFYQMVKDRTVISDRINDFRPKGIDFTGDIELEGTLSFEKEDMEKINNYFNTLKINNKKKQLDIPVDFSYTFKFKYKLHQYQKTNTLVGFHIKIKDNKKSLFESDKSTWQSLVNYIKTLIPEILYYDDFIFQIPEKITFSNQTTDLEEYNEMWKLVIDDILKSVNPELNFQKNVFEIWNSDKMTAKNGISQMEKSLNDKITTKWKDLFGNNNVNFEEIKLDVEQISDKLHLSFKIQTKLKKEFLVNERSKGFKWFFSFLLFTEFRKKRTKNILFLLDEPASNLHSSAQEKILDAIDELSKNSLVIYSTHSHHLINPTWLSGTYICINDNISLETLAGNFSEMNAIISIEKYFNYVGKGLADDKISYFQPILDKLDYKPSTVEPIPQIVITEGKNDWYTFKYFSEVIENKTLNIKFYPGGGVNKLHDIIRLYLSWGKDFLVILDGDNAGIRSKKAYMKDFCGFIDDKIFTLHDIFNSKITTEYLINDIDKKKICDKAFIDGTYDEAVKKSTLKRTLNMAINKLLKENTKLDMPQSTKQFKILFDFINKKLEL